MTATAAVLERPPAKTKPTLTHDVFMHHMDAMRAHYTGGKRGAAPHTTYALPVHLLHPVSEGGVMHGAATEGKAQVDTALKASQAQTLAFATHQKDAVTSATSKLQQDHDTSSFSQQMQALEGQAQQQAHDNIHQQFQHLIDIGTKHPEQQNRILSLTNQIGAFFTNLIASVGQFFEDIFKKIMGWINSAVDWIKGAAASVAHWVSGAAASIGSFFSGLF
jgi:Fe2+ transport system protein B